MHPHGLLEWSRQWWENAWQKALGFQDLLLLQKRLDGMAGKLSELKKAPRGPLPGRGFAGPSAPFRDLCVQSFAV